MPIQTHSAKPAFFAYHCHTSFITALTWMKFPQTHFALSFLISSNSKLSTTWLHRPTRHQSHRSSHFHMFCLAPHGQRHCWMDMPVHSLPKSQSSHSHLTHAICRSHPRTPFFSHSCGPHRPTSTFTRFHPHFQHYGTGPQEGQKQCHSPQPQSQHVPRHFALHGYAGLAFHTPSHLTVTINLLCSAYTYAVFRLMHCLCLSSVFPAWCVLV